MRRIFAGALLSLLMTLGVVLPATSANATISLNTGTSLTTVDIDNPSRPNNNDRPPVVTPPGDEFAGLTNSFLLYSANRIGTFAMNFHLTALDTPDGDSFYVKNLTNKPITLMYYHETEKVKPDNPARDMNELLVCFNQLCEQNQWVPDGMFVPPAPLTVLQPGQTQLMQVQLKLAPNANVDAWDTTTIAARLVLKAEPAAA